MYSFLSQQNPTERNLELARLKTTILRERYSDRYVLVVKKLVELNETLNRNLNIDADNIRNVIQQDAFLQIPYDFMKVKLSFTLCNYCADFTSSPFF